MVLVGTCGAMRGLRVVCGSRIALLIASALCMQSYPTTEGASVSGIDQKAFVSVPLLIEHLASRNVALRQRIAPQRLEMAREPASAKSSAPTKAAKLAQGTSSSKKASPKAATAEEVVRVPKPRGRPPASQQPLLFEEEDIFERPEQTSLVKRNVVEQILSTGSVTEVPTKEDLECLSVLTLKEICADLGLVQRGRKTELIDRIDAARSGSTDKAKSRRKKSLLRDQLEAQLRGI